MTIRTEALVEARAAHRVAANALERATLFRVSEVFQLN